MKTIQVSKANWVKINGLRTKNKLKTNNEVVDAMFSYIEEKEREECIQ